MVASKKYPPQKMAKGGLVNKLKAHEQEHNKIAELKSQNKMKKGGDVGGFLGGKLDFGKTKDEKPPMRKNKPARPGLKGSGAIKIGPQKL